MGWGGPGDRDSPFDPPLTVQLLVEATGNFSEELAHGREGFRRVHR